MRNRVSGWNAAGCPPMLSARRCANGSPRRIAGSNEDGLPGVSPSLLNRQGLDAFPRQVVFLLETRGLAHEEVDEGEDHVVFPRLLLQHAGGKLDIVVFDRDELEVAASVHAEMVES